MDIQAWISLKCKRVGLKKLQYYLDPAENINLQFLVSAICIKSRAQNRQAPPIKSSCLEI